MNKYTNVENWEIYYTPQTKKEKETVKAEAETAKKAVESFILENLNSLELRFISEEGEESATIADLEMAVGMARTSELQKFLKKNYIPFEDGKITVSVK